MASFRPTGEPFDVGENFQNSVLILSLKIWEEPKNGGFGTKYGKKLGLICNMISDKNRIKIKNHMKKWIKV